MICESTPRLLMPYKKSISSMGVRSSYESQGLDLWRGYQDRSSKNGHQDDTPSPQINGAFVTLELTQWKRSQNVSWKTTNENLIIEIIIYSI